MLFKISGSFVHNTCSILRHKTLCQQKTQLLFSVAAIFHGYFFNTRCGYMLTSYSVRLNMNIQPNSVKTKAFRGGLDIIEFHWTRKNLFVIIEKIFH